jgi:hypothetical protein
MHCRSKVSVLWSESVKHGLGEVSPLPPRVAFVPTNESLVWSFLVSQLASHPDLVTLAFFCWLVPNESRKQERPLGWFERRAGALVFQWQGRDRLNAQENRFLYTIRHAIVD